MPIRNTAHPFWMAAGVLLLTGMAATAQTGGPTPSNGSTLRPFPKQTIGSGSNAPGVAPGSTFRPLNGNQNGAGTGNKAPGIAPGSMFRSFNGNQGIIGNNNVFRSNRTVVNNNGTAGFGSVNNGAGFGGIRGGFGGFNGGFGGLGGFNSGLNNGFGGLGGVGILSPLQELMVLLDTLNTVEWILQSSTIQVNNGLEILFLFLIVYDIKYNAAVDAVLGRNLGGITGSFQPGIGIGGSLTPGTSTLRNFPRTR